jgi:hypothetical protein
MYLCLVWPARGARRFLKTHTDLRRSGGEGFHVFV